MRRSVQVSLAACAVALAAIGITNIASAARPGPSGPTLVSIDDGGKTAIWWKAPMAVGPGDETTVNFNPGNPTGVPDGMRLVVETISVWGNGSGPVTQDQGIERVLVGSNGGGIVAVPLDRYSWGSCPGNVAPENCGSYNRYWQYAGTVDVHIYVDAGTVLTATAWHPGDGVQHLSVLLFGYLVPLTSQQ